MSGVWQERHRYTLWGFQDPLFRQTPVISSHSSREADKLLVENLALSGQIEDATGATQHLDTFLTKQ